jgi:hypothetical protein
VSAAFHTRVISQCPRGKSKAAFTRAALQGAFRTHPVAY